MAADAMDAPVRPLFHDVTLAMISWKAPATVRHTLTSYRQADIVSLFGQTLIHFNEITADDQAIADEFGVTAIGAAENLGIYGGVASLAEHTRTRMFLLVENDCPLDTDRDGFIAMVSSVLADMSEHDVPVFLMRSRRNPGEPFWRRARYEKHFRVVWPLGSGAETQRKKIPLVRRVYEDNRRPTLRGAAIYAEEDPTVRHPDCISRSTHGNWLTSSRHLQWSNCCVMVRNDFLRTVVLERVRTHPSTTTLNGQQDIEASLKAGKWWRRQNFPMGQCEPGPFTHVRLDR
jgi:hypothetical protein